jgi:hypothetical protein
MDYNAAASKISIRTYRVSPDGQRHSETPEYVAPGTVEPTPGPMMATRWPPCHCPRCAYWP